MSGLPNYNLPKRTRRILVATCWLFEKRYVLATALALCLVVALAGSARASCGSIPDRQEVLCLQLGFDSSPCNIEWERNHRGKLKGGWGEIMLTSDTDVDEPLTGSAQPTTATVLRFKTSRAKLTKIFSPTNPDYNGLNKLPSDPPCVIPKCTRYQGFYGLDEYLGLDEWGLLDVANILNKSLFNPLDDRFNDRLREAHGATGLPVAVEAWIPKHCQQDESRCLQDETKTGLASSLRFEVHWLFALDASYSAPSREAREGKE